MRLILASESPRRKEYLALLISDFDVVGSDAPETDEGTPEERVKANARAKTTAVAMVHDGVVVGADTVVEIDGDVLGKPTSAEDARRMLHRLSGRAHRVLTGLCVVNTQTEAERSAVEETIVRFRNLTDAEIEGYLETGDPWDKAGAYGIQGRAAPFVEGILGDYYNVVGLPLCRLSLLLREVGFAGVGDGAQQAGSAEGGSR